MLAMLNMRKQQLLKSLCALQGSHQPLMAEHAALCQRYRSQQ
jgi:hypothetical protein